MNPNAHVVSFYIDMNDLFGELVFQMRNERDVSNAITTLYDPAVFPFRTNQANISVAEQVRMGLARLFSGEPTSLLKNQFLGVTIGDGPIQAGIVAQLDSKKITARLTSEAWKNQVFSTLQLQDLLDATRDSPGNDENPNEYTFSPGDIFSCHVLVTDGDQGPGIVSMPDAQNVNRDLWVFQMRHAD